MATSIDLTDFALASARTFANGTLVTTHTRKREGNEFCILGPRCG